MSEEPRKKMNVANPEIQALAKIDLIVSELTPEVRAKVINWLNATYPVPESKEKP